MKQTCLAVSALNFWRERKRVGGVWGVAEVELDDAFCAVWVYTLRPTE